MSSSLPDMSGYREDTVVNMWPQVSHRVHVVIGAFIVGSGQIAGQITIPITFFIQSDNLLLLQQQVFKSVQTGLSSDKSSAHFELHFGKVTLFRHLRDCVQHVPPHHPLQAEGEATGPYRCPPLQLPGGQPLHVLATVPLLFLLILCRKVCLVFVLCFHLISRGLQLFIFYR